MEEKHKVSRLNTSKLITRGLDTLFEICSPFYTPVILEAGPGPGKTSIPDTLRKNTEGNCFVILVYDHSLQWLEWLYEIRCKARFRGPCYLLGTDYPVKSQLPVFRGLFETVFKPYHAIFSYKDLHKLLERGGVLPPLLPYRRFRWIQRKIRALYLSISH